MQSQDWLGSTLINIQNVKQSINAKDQKKLKLELLERIARRAASFSHTCQECQQMQTQITELLQNINGQIQLSSSVKKSYHRELNSLVRHLSKTHKLVAAGFYIGVGLVLGTGVGVALGSALENVGAGIAIGVGLGMALGSGLQNRAKNEGKTI